MDVLYQSKVKMHLASSRLFGRNRGLYVENSFIFIYKNSFISLYFHNWPTQNWNLVYIKQIECQGVFREWNFASVELTGVVLLVLVLILLAIRLKIYILEHFCSNCYSFFTFSRWLEVQKLYILVDGR